LLCTGLDFSNIPTLVRNEHKPQVLQDDFIQLICPFTLRADHNGTDTVVFNGQLYSRSGFLEWFRYQELPLRVDPHGKELSKKFIDKFKEEGLSVQSFMAWRVEQQELCSRWFSLLKK